MAEQPKAPPTKAPPAPEPAAAVEKKKLPVKMLGIVGAALVIEAVTICGVFMFASRPAEVKAEGAVKDVAIEQPVEELVVADKFQNTRTGRTYIYDTEIYILVPKTDQNKVEDELKDMQAQISADVALIFRKAEPAYLLEPTLASLTRHIRAALDQRMGMDPQGKSMINDVLIKKFTQYRADL